jgi:glutaredoxin
MTADKNIVVYTRSTGCPYWSIARRVLNQYKLDYREILIDEDPEAMQRVLDWTGFRSVPTIIVANPGEDLPCEDPAPLEPGQSPRGVDRGSMITEASSMQLTAWLRRHGFID